MLKAGDSILTSLFYFDCHIQCYLPAKNLKVSIKISFLFFIFIKQQDTIFTGHYTFFFCLNLPFYVSKHIYIFILLITNQ